MLGYVHTLTEIMPSCTYSLGHPYFQPQMLYGNAVMLLSRKLICLAIHSQKPCLGA